MTSPATPIRVLVADDSPTVRYVIAQVLEEDSRFEVVGQARDGSETVRLAAELEPSLITMDVEMPNMDGLAATRIIMAERPTPIVIVTSTPVGRDAPLTFEAIRAGAVDVCPKPDRREFARSPAMRRRFVEHLAAMAEVQLVRRRPVRSKRARRPSGIGSRQRCIVLGASAGGPPVVQKVLSELTASSPPVLLVQHMAAGFVGAFAAWLDREITPRVVLAESRTTLAPGHVYVAPDDCHLRVTPSGRLVLDDSPPRHFHRPSIDVLFESAHALVHQGGVVGVLLTGMGRDGAEGLLSLRRAGASTVAQDEESSAVYGMPAAAARLDAAGLIAAPQRIAALLGGLNTHEPTARRSSRERTEKAPS